MMSDADGSFISEKLKEFCRNKPECREAISSSYHHQNNVKAEACIKLIKWTVNKLSIDIQAENI